MKLKIKLRVTEEGKWYACCVGTAGFTFTTSEYWNISFVYKEIEFTLPSQRG